MVREIWVHACQITIGNKVLQETAQTWMPQRRKKCFANGGKWLKKTREKDSQSYVRGRRSSIILDLAQAEPEEEATSGKPSTSGVNDPPNDKILFRETRYCLEKWTYHGLAKHSIDCRPNHGHIKAHGRVPKIVITGYHYKK